MMAVVPLYVEDHYFNILQAKGHAFSAGCILGTALLVIYSLATRDRSKSHAKDPKLTITDAGFIVLGATALISCLLSGDFMTAFLGEKGWGVGGLALAGSALIYLLLSRSISLKHNIWLVVIAVNCFIFSIGILHSAGTDALGLHGNIIPDQFYWYISTIGNINWYSGYLCLIMPMLAIFFVEAEDRSSQIIYLIVLALGEVNMVFSGSDSLYLGIGFCAFWGIPYMLSGRGKAIRTFIIAFIYGLSLMMADLLPAFGPKQSSLTGISLAFTRPAAYISIMVISAAGILLFSAVKDEAFRSVSKTLTLVLELALAATAIVFLIRAFGEYDVHWGHNRGRTWNYSMEIFAGLPLIQKIFGVGPEMLGSYYSELSEQFARPVLAAHSEPLQILLTTGISGLIGWLAIWTGTIKKYFELKIWKSGELAFFLPAAAYLGQSLVNSATATNVGVLIIILSLFNYRTKISYCL